jgi:steroid 5-alpha reductase family enzyme
MKKIINSKIYSIIVIGLIYILASIIAVIVYNSLSFNQYINILVSDIAATIIVYIFSVIFNNSSIYDPYWSVQPIVIVVLYLINKTINISSILSLIAILLWGIRLTVNWAYTFPNLTKQDWRYTKYKNETGIFYQPVNFFGIHLMPTLLVYLAVIPVITIVDSNSFNIGSVIGFIISITAILVQAIADYEMHKFRKKNTGKLIREGLWKYSRHPNYLGEILMWWGIAIQAFSISKEIWTLLGAVLITIMFLIISIPLAEKRQSKKDGFIEYKKETRCLLPIKK